MKHVIFITSADASPGFQLAGLEQIPATKDTVTDLLRQNTRNNDIGLIVVDERLLDGTTREEFNRLDKLRPGKIATLPSPEFAETDLALEIIRQAIGYHIRMHG